MENQNNEVQQAVNDALVEQKKKKKKKRLIIIAVIAVLVIIIAVASGNGADSSSTDNNTDEKTSSISAEKDVKDDGTIGDYVCKVKSAKIVNNWEGKASVKITYEFTNNDSEPISFDIALTDELYQDGIGLESTFISSDEDDWGIDVKIKQGTTKEVSKVYVLRDTTTPIEVEISELISLSDDKLTYTVNLDK